MDYRSVSDEDWKKKLTPEQYHVLRERGTEIPFTGILNENFEKGLYECVACGAELFSSDSKFESHCGWPSFDRSISDNKNVELHEDTTFGMIRTEVVCRSCGGHLGHVFDDGPTDSTGKRFCINSAALNFKKL